MAKQQKTPRIDVDTDSLPLALSLGALLGRENVPELPESAPGEEERTARPNRELPGRVVLTRETKSRGGKTVTRISFREGAPSDPAALAKRLRSTLGCGGTVEGGDILLQGDQTERSAEWFTAKKVKVTKAH